MANDKDFRIKNGLQLGGSFIGKVGTVTGNATLDLSTGNVFSVTPTADVTFTFSNAPESGAAFDFALKVNGVLIDNAYDLANASYDSVSFSVSAQETSPTGLFFKPDGTKMYILGGVGDDVNEYSLSSAWDVGTASYVQNFSVSAQDAGQQGIFFKPDGTKMYVVGSDNDAAYEYSLSSAWDISTASYVQNFSVSAQDSAPTSLFFKPDGTKMYVLGVVGIDVNEYSLSSAWDISTASYVQNFSVAGEETNPQSVFFGDNGTKMYIIGYTGDTVYQYTTGTYGDVTFTYPTSVKWPAGTPPPAPADGETDLLEFYTDDAGTTYYGVRLGDDMS